MTKRKVSDSVLCPYHKGLGKQELYCEGVQPNTVIRLSFGSITVFSQYKYNRCDWDYDLCPIAQMLNQLWEERNNGDKKKV